jgi:parallel beta-helix repeat protein
MQPTIGTTPPDDGDADGCRGRRRWTAPLLALGVLGLAILAVPIVVGLDPIRRIVAPIDDSALVTGDRATCPDTIRPVSPTPSAVPGVTVLVSIQALVDAAEPGSTLTVPAGIHREAVTIDKPLTLRAEPGAEIRGSDVWTDWTKQGSVWTSGPVEQFEPAGKCRAGSGRCLVRNQLFIDGEPQVPIESTPGPGEFSIGPSGVISIGQDPALHLVEVTTRDVWVSVEADEVTIDGFRMRHSATEPQSGGIRARHVDRVTIRGNQLSDSHGAAISISGGSDHEVVGNDLHSNGQEGLHTTDVRTMLVEDNLIRGNNTADFDPGWEAGGLKATETSGLRLIGNEVCSNGGPGLWCDIDCDDTVVQGNRVHGNGNAGIHFEISRGADISDNVVWSNGWDFPVWGWGAGILISSAADARVSGNVVAWNADGISVISQDRGEERWNRVDGVEVTDNDVLVGPVGRDTYALAWLDDWDSGMFDDDRGNVGRQNRYWYGRPEDGRDRFVWERGYARLDGFEATPGEEAARYVTAAERTALLEQSGVPPAS